MSDTPPISRAYARRCVMRILQVIAVLGAFWALSACISLMNGKKVTEAPPAPPQSGTLMRGSKSIDLLLSAPPGSLQGQQQQNAAPLMMGSKSAPPMKP